MTPEELEADRADYFNRGLETAAHILDIEHLRLHSLAAICTGERQRQMETNARYAALIATLIREKRKK